MPTQSAGILLHRRRDGTLEVFLVHPGGPFWAKKDAGAWSIPKGEFSPDTDDPLTAARREFHEETGHTVDGEFRPLTPLKQSAAKMVHAWAVQGDLDPQTIRSNTFTMEWPPRSGKQQSFPEVDRGEWFTLDEARVKMLKGQTAFLDELEKSLIR
jgi:predicted NUDIX family NTP pyrophosphohydrolase